jgi:hypothetical protein
MTTKSRDKWLPALLLAGIVHVIVFAALYINYANNNKPLATETNPTNAQPTLSDTTSQPTALVSETEIIEVPVIAKEVPGVATEVPVIEGAPPQSVETQSASSLQPAGADNKSSATDSKTLTGTPIENASEGRQTTANSSPSPSKPSSQTATTNVGAENTSDSVANNPLSTQRPNPALLDMDMPSQGSKGKTALDQQYNAVKDETEALNAKMSSGISEIKSRNQKRIEEAQAMQAYAHAVDNGRPSVALTSKPAAKDPSTGNSEPNTTKSPSNRLTTPTGNE